MNLHAVCVRFNPCCYKVPVENYWRFREALPADLPLLTVEAVYPGQQPTVPDAHHIYATHRQIMWQRERMVNLAETLIPEEYDAICWLDADLLWRQADWHYRAAGLLGDVDFVQLFSRVRRGRGEHLGTAAAVKTGQSFKNTAPGLAWAARRDVFRRIGGLPDYWIVGGGDKPLSDAVLQIEDRETYDIYPPRLRIGTERLQQAMASLGVTWGYLRRTVVRHLRHGRSRDRQYVGRHRHRALHHFDPARHIRVAANGLAEFTDEAPAGLALAVAEYFFSRQEDR